MYIDRSLWMVTGYEDIFVRCEYWRSSLSRGRWQDDLLCGCEPASYSNRHCPCQAGSRSKWPQQPNECHAWAQQHELLLTKAKVAMAAAECPRAEASTEPNTTLLLEESSNHMVAGRWHLITSIMEGKVLCSTLTLDMNLPSLPAVLQPKTPTICLQNVLFITLAFHAPKYSMGNEVQQWAIAVPHSLSLWSIWLGRMNGRLVSWRFSYSTSWWPAVRLWKCIWRCIYSKSLTKYC